MSADPKVIEAALRSLTDCGEREFHAAIRERQDLFIKAGALNSSRAQICQSEDIEGFFRARAEAAVAKIQLARNVVPAEHVQQLRDALTKLRDTIMDWRRGRLGRAGGVVKTPEAMRHVLDPLEEAMNKAIEDAALTVEHFHPTAPNPAQGNVIVTNNTGNTNVAAGAHAKAAQSVGAELSDLAGIISTVRGELALLPDSAAKTDALDTVEVIEAKIAENAPLDQIGRWVKRGMETVEKVGVATVGPLLTAWLKTHGF